LLGQTGATSAYLRIAEEHEAQFSRDGLDKLMLRHVPDRQSRLASCTGCSSICLERIC